MSICCIDHTLIILCLDTLIILTPAKTIYLSQDGDSAVILATWRHESDALREIVHAGADLNIMNKVRCSVDTALHHCIIVHNRRALQL